MFRRIIYLFSRNEPVESIALSLKPVPKQRWRNKAERPRPNPNFGVRVYDPLCTWVIDSKTQFEKTFCKNEYLTIGKCQDVLEEEQWRYLRVIFFCGVKDYLLLTLAKNFSEKKCGVWRQRVVKTYTFCYPGLLKYSVLECLSWKLFLNMDSSAMLWNSSWVRFF